MLTSCVLVLSVVAFGLVLAVISVPFQSMHGIFGLVVFILSFLQAALGQYINEKFDAYRQKIPLHDMLHWWLGRLVWVLSLVTMALGTILISEESYLLLMIYLITMAVILMVFVVAEVRLGQSDHEVVSSNSDAKHSSNIELISQG